MTNPEAEAESNTPTVSIVIVSYNTRDLTLTCLHSVSRQSRQIPLEVIVVDNASRDGSADVIEAQYPSVNLIRSAVNLGFGRAVNLAAKEARGEYLLLLNTDATLFDDAIDRLTGFAKGHPENRIYGGLVLEESGKVDLATCQRHISLWSMVCMAVGLNAVFPRNRLLNRELMPEWDRSTVREVEVLTGCLFLIDRTLWQKLDGFDPLFFLYGEDADLCYRAALGGNRPLFCPQAMATHRAGASSPHRATMLNYLAMARVSIMERYWPAWQRPMIKPLMMLWIVLRLTGAGVLSTLRMGKHSWRCNHWREVWRARSLWLKGFTTTKGVPCPGPAEE